MRFMSAATFVCWILGIAMPLMSTSAEIENGIYRVLADDKGFEAARTSGGKVRLGDRLSQNFGSATIWSLSNQNDRFRLLMKEAGPFDHQGQAAIYVDGVCEVIGSYSEPDAAGKLELIADIEGQANIRKVAAVLQTKPIERKHPGHQLRVSWRPVQESYKAGEAVLLELTIENVGTTTVRFIEGGKQRGARDNQFGFTAFAGSGFGKPIPDTGDPTNFGGLGAFRELKPNDVFQKQVDISKWFQFEAPDTYLITGMYELELQEKDFGARVLWEEFATGRCFVRFEK
jgi:hypothetical protein